MKIIVMLIKSMVFCCLTCLFCASVWGGIDNAIMEGIVISYDKKTVTLSQKGNKVKIPRSSIPKHIKLKTGKRIEVPINSEKLLKQMLKLKNQQKPKQARPSKPKAYP